MFIEEFNKTIPVEGTDIKLSVTVKFDMDCYTRVGYIQVINGTQEFLELAEDACHEYMHGGVTYETEDTWGFDCDHSDDGPDVESALEYGVDDTTMYHAMIVDSYKNEWETRTLEYCKRNILEVLTALRTLYRGM